ncbi:hypothetical protein E2C01_046623 [Portunus trituberculatus]|uniref:Uncharacterized protein n=1 Tax=Portunus trituberculatus TaxID=210409 RepID=A0A5B7G5A6_PORTR|nr:hypothetical protein [Portunus trituberculatus]
MEPLTDGHSGDALVGKVGGHIRPGQDHQHHPSGIPRPQPAPRPRLLLLTAGREEVRMYK